MPQNEYTPATGEPRNTTQPVGQPVDWFANNTPTAPSAAGATPSGVQQQIAQAFIRQGIEPTPQLVSQWGTNIDAGYLSKILAQIGTLPRGNYTVPDANAPTTGTGTGTTASRDFGDLTDPTKWMGLVGNQADLLAWVKQNNPGISDQLAQYYAGKIQGQPGANAQEQAGSAQYWLDKIKNDPELGGKGSGVPGTPGNQEFSYPSWDQTFTAPTDITEQNDPGFAARMKLGTDALQRSAAAKGSVLDTGTLKDLNTYAQNYASNEYAQVYNRQAGEYNQRYQQYLNGFQNALSAFGTNFGVDQTLWNRALTQQGQGFQQLMSVANLGLQGTAGSANAGTNYGAQAGADYTGIGNAGAAGTVGAGNAYAGLYSNLANYGNQAYWQSQHPFGGGGGWGNY